MSSPACIAIVTGANRVNGVGFACVRQLAFQYSSSTFNRGPLLIYMTSRNKESGEKALQTVTQQIQEHQATTKDASPPVEVKLALLDIESDESIAAFAASMAANHPGGIDILINNAAVLGLRGEEGLKPDMVEWTVKCNYYGTQALTDALLPQIREGGRIVNVASVAGSLAFGTHRNYSEETDARWLEAETVEDIDGIVKDFAAAAEKGDLNGWPQSAYAVSKAAVVGVTRVLAQQFAKTNRQILINCCCPGIVLTDMYATSGSGTSKMFGDPKTPDGGAKTPVLLAIGDIGGQNGQFWRDEKVVEWK